MNYIHSHTDYSNLKLRDCIIKPNTSVNHCFELGATAAFITDHDSLSGHVKFWQSVQKIRNEGKEKLKTDLGNLTYQRMANFKAILGNEIYLTKEGMSSETWEKGDKFYHLILLAKDRIGWEQLNELSSRAWSRSFFKGITRTPTYLSDLLEIVKPNSGHIIISSACLGNKLAELILHFHLTENCEYKEQAIAYIQTMKEIVGENNFYLEIQPSEYPEQIDYNNWLKAFAEKTNTPLVIATDSHYLTIEDREIHKAFLNSQSDLKGEREVDSFYKYAYFQTEEEIRTYLNLCSNITPQDINKMIENTYHIANQCEYYQIDSALSVPSIDVRNENWEKLIHKYDNYEIFNKFSHSNYEIDRYFIYKIIKGIEEKIEKNWLIDNNEVLERLNIELHQVWESSEKTGQRISNYFNTMQEMLLKIWEISIIGPGRGSAVGFLIDYILDITQINPLTTPVECPYWRFLDESRPELPDIDIDSCASQKDNIFNLLTEWFKEMGKMVTHVATFGTEKSKSALITAARGLGYEPEIGLFLASTIPIDRGFPRKLKVCLEGDEHNNPVKEFIDALKDYPDVLKVAIGIEGLVNSLSQHSAAILIIDKDDLYNRMSIVKTPGGGITSAYSLDDIDSTIKLVKYDMLVVNALDSIQTNLYLLAEHGYIDWQNSLKETYDKYIHPEVINYNEPEMWKLVQENKVLGLFQYDSPQGVQAISLVKPNCLAELAAANSAMRLMANEFHSELPLISFAKQKENLQIWYNDMARYSLLEKEIKILEKHLLKTYGMCIEQENIMLLSLDKEISNFSMEEANKIRKVIGKKQISKIPEIKELFINKGIQNGCRETFLNYIWNEAFMLSMGYSFSTLHSLAYSIIAVQELNLNYFYPSIFWATARLMVDSSSIDFIEEDFELLNDDEEEEIEEETKKSKSVNYFKMSSALGKIRKFGIEVYPPDINKSTFTFKPNVEENVIYFGLTGITRLGNKAIYNIIENRPYVSLEDFIGKVKLNKIQLTMLIKAGAFDSFGDRESLLFQYCESVADIKKKLTLQNMSKLIEYNLIPEEYNDYITLFKLNKFLRKNNLYEDIIILTDDVKDYVQNLGFSNILYGDNSEEFIDAKEWEKFYKKGMEVVKYWIKENESLLLEEMNNKAINLLLEKYAKGDKAAREMEALSYYYSYHEMEVEPYKSWLTELGVKDFFELPEEPIVEWENGAAKKFKLYRIAGTAIGRDKSKHIVGIETPTGFITTKIYRSQFVKFDKQIKLDGLTEKSWFVKGNKLLLSGYRNGDTFVLKTYKNHSYGQALYLIEQPGMLKGKRLGE